MSNFLESSRVQVPAIKDDQEIVSSVKISFYPETDDLAYVAEQVNKSYKFPKRAAYTFQAFLFLNFIGLPAVLLYFELVIAALVVFALNLLFAIVFTPTILRADYRRYFRSMFQSIENELAEVELTDNGVWCRHADCMSFYSWNKIKRLEETKQSIYFFFEHTGLAVTKSGFAYDEEKNRFLAFAKRHVKDFTTS